MIQVKDWLIMLSIQEIKKQFNKQELHPIYLLTGEEYFFIDQFKKMFLELFPDEQNEEMTEYDLREISIQEVLADAETLPFFSEKKIIIVDQAYFLTAKQIKSSVTHDISLVEKYVQNPAPYTHLIFIAPYEQLDGRKKVTKLFRKHTVEVNCNSIKGNELSSWVQEMIKPYNVHITNDARSILESEFSTNLYLLQKEIEKIVQFIGEGGTITDNVLGEIMSTSLQQTALELVDAVLNKNLSLAISIYKQLEKMREDPIGLIALLAYQFRILYQVKLLQDKGYSLYNIRDNVRAHPYVIKLAAERSRKFSKKYLQMIIHELVETDTLIKQGRMDKGIAFEMLLYRVTA